MLELLNKLLRLVHIQHGNRGTAVSAGAGSHEIDRCATIRAIDDLNLFSQVRDLLRRERPNKILFLQEIKKTDESPVPVIAPPISESGVALHVMRLQQVRVASRALKPRRQ